jgi:hypothetical protein
MRGWRHALGAAVLGAVVGGGAEAGPLASASLEIRFGGHITQFPSSGATGTATGTLYAALGGGPAFAGTDVVSLLPSERPKNPVDRYVLHVTANQAGSFAGLSPDQLGGAATFSGFASLSVTATVPCCPDPFLKVPVQVGGPIVLTAMGSGLAYSIYGAPWTAGKASVTDVSPGIGTGTPTTLFVTGANALTPGGAGTLTLVSPGKIHVSTGPSWAVIGTLTLTYVPEPGTLVLFGGGALALGAIARERRAR